METHQTKSTDIPAPLALAGLAGIMGSLLYLDSPKFIIEEYARIDRYLDTHPEFVGILLLSWTLNGIGVYSGLSRLFGVSKQGSRLEVMTGQRSDSQKNTGKTALISLATGALTYEVLRWIPFPSLREMDLLTGSGLWSNRASTFIQAQFAVNSALLVWMMGRFPVWKKMGLFQFSRKLPEFPKPKNGIVIGSLYDDDLNKNPSWVTLLLKALNGNILFTGSIGSGKTQGGILPTLDQILGNCDGASMLILDPKGTFIPEAIEIIKRHGREADILHIKLGGNVTFNPLWSESPLKKSQFQEIAHMLRAASINFSGQDKGSSFWDISASNLMKNSIALCAVKKIGIFTLNDLYREMVYAAKGAGKTATFLKEASQKDIYDEEEKFNLICASDYFVELGQMDEKVRTGVLATATSFLNQFQEYQASQIFCPSPDQTTLKNIDDAVDKGKIILFDVDNPGLARSMGTLLKLHYESSVLNRLKNPKRGKERLAVILADEYQDVVSTGGGITLGDDRFCAKSREANACAIFATQSLTSLKNSIGKEDAAKELFQNFRTMIACHSTDLTTIHSFQELMGKEDEKKTSHSVSENAHRPSRNLILGGFETQDANISESISTSSQKEYRVTGKEFSTLGTFEAFARIYDGQTTQFHKLFLKPYFLKKKNVLQPDLLKTIQAACVVLGLLFGWSQPSYAFPNVCTVIKSSDFGSCLNLQVGACMCGWPIPRPCAQFSYYEPKVFVESFPDAKSTYFDALPGAALQLALMGKSASYGAQADEDTQSYQSHALQVPLENLAFAALPCGSNMIENLCFGAMSEQIGDNWNNGSADSLQPAWLAWQLSPTACMLKGAADSLTTSGEPASPYPTVPACGIPMSYIPKYPPSNHSVCNGWGTFFPRSGVYNGPSQTVGALMTAARIKSLGTDIFHTIPSSGDEMWQMIQPQNSSCFREGQNVAALETLKGVREEKRLMSRDLKGYLFTVWSKVSCCRDLAIIPEAIAVAASLGLICQGL